MYIKQNQKKREVNEIIAEKAKIYLKPKIRTGKYIRDENKLVIKDGMIKPKYNLKLDSIEPGSTVDNFVIQQAEFEKKEKKNV